MFNSKMDMLKTWMRSKHFDLASQQKIEEFYAARLSGATGSKVVDETQIFAMFQPAPIADELIAMLYIDTISEVPMFTCLTREVVTRLCLCLHRTLQQHVLPPR